MAAPTKSAVQSAADVISQADAVMLAAAVGVFDPVIAANNTAIATIDAAIAMYDTGSATQQALQGWRNQLAAFSPTFGALKADLDNRSQPPVDEGSGDTPPA